MAEIVKMEYSKEFQDFLNKAQPGDMIEFVRGGYSHWAVYIGGGIVIHRWGENDGIGQSVGLWGNVTTVFGAEFNKAKILQSDVCDVLKHGGKIRINNYLDSKYKPLPVEAILDKARSSIDREGYNLIYSNCEHFTTDCRYGQSTSRQVQTAVVSSIAAGIFISFVAFAGAYYLGSSPKKEDEEEEK